MLCSRGQRRASPGDHEPEFSPARVRNAGSMLSTDLSSARSPLHNSPRVARDRHLSAPSPAVAHENFRADISPLFASRTNTSDYLSRCSIPPQRSPAPVPENRAPHRAPACAPQAVRNPARVSFPRSDATRESAPFPLLARARESRAFDARIMPAGVPPQHSTHLANLRGQPDSRVASLREKDTRCRMRQLAVHTAGAGAVAFSGTGAGIARGIEQRDR